MEYDIQGNGVTSSLLSLLHGPLLLSSTVLYYDLQVTSSSEVTHLLLSLSGDAESKPMNTVMCQHV